MADLTLQLSDIVDRALLELVSPGERGHRVVMGSDDLANASDTQFTLTDATGVNVFDLVEFGDELMLVTDKTGDAVPVFTCSRAQFFSEPEASVPVGTVGFVSPAFPRVKVIEGVRRAFGRLEALGIPLIKTGTLQRETGLSYILLPDDVRVVLEVLYHGTDGRLVELTGWRFFDDLPTAKFSTGKALNVSTVVADDDELEVVYRAPYRWSTHPNKPDATATISIPEGAEELPSLYAAAWCIGSREISRTEIDRSDEWARTEQQERGASAALIRAKWQEFYRALDEARRLNPVPRPLQYRKFQRTLS